MTIESNKVLATIAIPSTRPDGSVQLRVEQGKAIVFLGANGGGKTRLGVHIEELIASSAHRLAAQRMLQFSASVMLSDLESASEKLKFGIALRDNPGLVREHLPTYKRGNRYQNRPATVLLNDYDALLQALFANQTREILAFHQAARRGHALQSPPLTTVERAQRIWEALLPHRALKVREAAVWVAPAHDPDDLYEATELSDGERAIFYLIGQVLMLESDAVLIVDEPELHIHRALVARLWDALEAERPDCAFIYITHDLEFAVTRTAAQKYALLSYVGKPTPAWEIKRLPDDEEGAPEEVACLVAGSRHPLLFIEGSRASLDFALFRRVYSDHTVIPVGGCSDVINSVRSFRAHTSLHRLDAFGVVDADGMSHDDAARMATWGVMVLPVTEIENVLLLPEVFGAIAATLEHGEGDVAALTAQMAGKVFDAAQRDVDGFALRYAKRRIDHLLKSIGIDAQGVDRLAAAFQAGVARVDPNAIYQAAHSELSDAVARRDLKAVLRLYDNKGLLGPAAVLLGLNFKGGLEQYVTRILRTAKGKPVLDALVEALPKVGGLSPTTSEMSAPTIAA